MIKEFPQFSVYFLRRDWGDRAVALIGRHAKVIAVMLVLVASVRIVLTWNVFNATTDEPTHIACGMEWLDQHTYRIEDQHPPLARVAAALGPYLFGIRSQGKTSPSLEGEAILLAHGRLERNLALSRAGTLPFFWIACIVVFAWGRFISPAGGVFALATFTHAPAVLAHAGLATTDMAVTAMLGAAALAALFWVEQPSTRRSLLLGVAGGLAAVSKFSSVPFFLGGIACILIWHAMSDAPIAVNIRTRHVRLLCLSFFTAGLLVWASYRFSYGPVRSMNATLPAPEFFSGIRAVKQHNDLGQLGYLLGSQSHTGFWDYYLIGFAVKTPIAYLALLGAGAYTSAKAWRRDPRLGYPLVFSVGILIVSVVFSRINIGIRHVLPVYVGFSVVAANGIITLLRRRLTSTVGVALLVWLVLSAALAHPHYLAYFNEMAAKRPERVLIDSDLDWGQDMKQLAIRLRELHVEEFSYLPLVNQQLSPVQLPANHPMDLEHPSPGWHAAHITALKLREYELGSYYPRTEFWPESFTPTERIGKGILLWELKTSAERRAERNESKTPP